MLHLYADTYYKHGKVLAKRSVTQIFRTYCTYRCSSGAAQFVFSFIKADRKSCSGNITKENLISMSNSDHLMRSNKQLKTEKRYKMYELVLD